MAQAEFNYIPFDNIPGNNTIIIIIIIIIIIQYNYGNLV